MENCDVQPCMQKHMLQDTYIYKVRGHKIAMHIKITQLGQTTTNHNWDRNYTKKSTYACALCSVADLHGGQAGPWPPQHWCNVSS